MKIYCIENKLDGKKYVGLTKGTIERRYKSHKDIARSEKSKKHHIHKAMSLYGINNFICYEIDSANTYEELCEKEKEWIKKLDTKNNGYNETLGGDGGLGCKHTEETKKLLSELSKKQWSEFTEDRKKELIDKFNATKIGNKHALGKTWTLSEESKKNVSESKKGFKHTDETKRKLSEKAKLRTGRKNSPETIEKMRIAAKNRIRKVGT